MTLNFDLTRYDALSLAKLISDKEISPLELLEAVIKRIESVKELNCVCYPNYEAARQKALGKLGQGPFSGLPLFLKDLILFHKDTLMSSGSGYLKDFVAPYSHYIVQKLLDSGMIFTSRTTSSEFGSIGTVESKYWGVTHNPWHKDYSTGGSSGGAAALVASRIFPIADGNDGGGSVRCPAALCGIVGFKYSRGRHSFSPLPEWRYGMAACGSMSLTVRDAAAYLDIVGGNVPGDRDVLVKPDSYLKLLDLPTKKLRIGLMKDISPNFAKDNPECRKAVEDIAELCRALGHEVTEFNSIADIGTIAQHFYTTGNVWVAFRIKQCAKAIGGRLPKEEELEASIWESYQLGLKISAAEHESNLEAMRKYGMELTNDFLPYDLVLTPTLATDGIKLGLLNPKDPSNTESLVARTEYIKYSTMLNITGQPGISLPVAISSRGLPIGVQIFGKIGSEDIILQLSRDIEEARPWFDKLPPMVAKNL